MLKGRKRGALAAVAAALPLAAAALLVAGPAGAEIEQVGDLQVVFNGAISPAALPRHREAPVSLHVQAAIRTSDHTTPRPMRHLKIVLNRNGALFNRGLPTCTITQIKATSTSTARSTCSRALVGQGHFSGRVSLPAQAPFPAAGKLLAFNSSDGGRPQILLHVYSAKPAPTTILLPVSIHKLRHGTFGTVLSVKLPTIGSDNGFVTGFDVTFHRTYRYRGKRHSFISASCPAARGFRSAAFTLARGTFNFAGHKAVSVGLRRRCQAVGR